MITIKMPSLYFTNCHIVWCMQAKVKNLKMMEFSFLNQLSNKSGKSKIKIRVSRMWGAVNRNNQEIISSDMILIDEQVCISLKKNTSKHFLYIIYIIHFIYLQLTSFTCRIMQYILPFIRIFQKNSNLFWKKGSCMHYQTLKLVIAMNSDRKSVV